MLRPSFVAACKAAAEDLAARHARRSRRADRPAVARRGEALQCGGAAQRRQDRDAALQVRSAELRRVRRKARLRCRARRPAPSISRACASAFRSARTSGRKRPARRWPRPAPKSCSCPTARPSSRTRTMCGSISSSRASPRRACRLPISTRSAARTNWSSTAPPSCSMPTARSPCRCRCSKRRWPSPNGQRGADGWRMAQGRDRQASGEAKRRPGGPASSASRTMSRRTAFPAWCSGFRAASIRPSSRPWRSMRWAPRRVHCVMLPYAYTSRDSLADAEACAKAARRALRRGADQGAGRRLSLGAQAAVRRAATATSPRRTSSRAAAARSSWRSPTNSARWC